MPQSIVQIQFDQLSARYAPGAKVSGKVIVTVRRELRILGIDMNLLGKVKVSSIPADRQLIRRGHKRLSSHSNTDKYFILKECKALHRDGAEEAEDENHLQAGVYEYPFKWTLPENLPASFEGPYGWIRYRGEVVVRHSFWDHRCEAEAEFLVTGHYDLNNLDREYREVQVEDKWTRTYNEYSGANHIEMTFELERRAYAPGDRIRFAATADFRNDGGHPPIPGVQVALMQEQTYRVKETVKRHMAKIYETRGDTVFPNAIQVWNGSFTLPPTAPTGLGGTCRIIDVQYFLVVSLRTTAGSTETIGLDTVMKLQIGTVSLKQRRRRAPQHPPTPRPPLAQLDSFPSSSLELEFPPIPPSYDPEEPVPSTSTGITHSPSRSTHPTFMDFLSVQPGPSRRASAPSSSLELDLCGGPASAPPAPSSEPETPPPSYSDALFVTSPGFVFRDNGENPPEYPKQPPFFLRKGAKHLFDSYNVYSTL